MKTEARRTPRPALLLALLLLGLILLSAQAAAEGCRRAAKADWALSTTGIAGPDGGTPTKPVGTAYIACAGPAGTAVKELHLRGDRTRVRAMSCLYALDLLRRELNK